MEYNSAIKKNELLIHATKMSPECAKWKKPITKATLYVSIIPNVQIRKIYSQELPRAGVAEWRMGTDC